MAKYSSVGKDLGKAGAAFGAGWLVQMLEYYWFAYSTGQHANYPGETLDAFYGYWSPTTSPWNFAGLVAGLGLSLVPEKPGSTGRELAKILGYGILGAEGWGYAGHNQNIPSGQAFGLVSVSVSGPGITPPSAPRIPADATKPRSSFYNLSRTPGDTQPRSPAYFF